MQQKDNERVRRYSSSKKGGRQPRAAAPAPQRARPRRPTGLRPEPPADAWGAREGVSKSGVSKSRALGPNPLRTHGGQEKGSLSASCPSRTQATSAAARASTSPCSCPPTKDLLLFFAFLASTSPYPAVRSSAATAPPARLGGSPCYQRSAIEPDAPPARLVGSRPRGHERAARCGAGRPLRLRSRCACAPGEGRIEACKAGRADIHW